MVDRTGPRWTRITATMVQLAGLVTLLCAVAPAVAVLGAPGVAPLADRSLTSRTRKGLAFGAGGRRQKRAAAWRIQDGEDRWSGIGVEDQEETKEPEQIKLVPVVLGVMSRCPDAILCEGVFDKVLSSVGNKVDISLVYIGKCDSIPFDPVGYSSG